MTMRRWLRENEFAECNSPYECGSTRKYYTCKNFDSSNIWAFEMEPEVFKKFVEANEQMCIPFRVMYRGDVRCVVIKEEDVK